jgi:hypothetical protein
MSDDLSRVVLGSILMKPQLLESSDLGSSDFPPGRLRETFAAIAELWENDRSPEIDPIILSERLGDGAASFVSELMSGMVRPDPEMFAIRVGELRRRKLSERIVRLAEDLGRTHLKTGAFDPAEFNKLRQLVIEQDELAESKAQTPIAAESLRSLIERETPEIPSLIEPILRSREIIVLSGFPKVGKSIASTNLAIRLATGGLWLGFTIPKPGNTLIFQTENTEALFKERILKMAYGLADDSFLDCISFVKDRGLMLDSKAGFSAISRAIATAGENVKLVVFDPLIDYHGRKENDAAEMATVFRCLRELTDTHNVAILIIHHFAKLTEGREGGYMARGSGVISASSDGNWQFQRLNRAQYQIGPDEYFRTAELSFESRNCAIMRPKTIRLSDNLWFDECELEKKFKLDQWDIVNAVKEAGGQVPRADLERRVREKTKCAHGTFLSALEEAEQAGLIDEADLPGARGSAKVVMLRAQDAESD